MLLFPYISIPPPLFPVFNTNSAPARLVSLLKIQGTFLLSLPHCNTPCTRNVLSFAYLGSYPSYKAALITQLTQSTLGHPNPWSLPLWSFITFRIPPAYHSFYHQLTSLEAGPVRNLSCRWLAGKERAFQFFPFQLSMCALPWWVPTWSKDVCRLGSLRKGTVENCQGNTVPVIFDGTLISTLTTIRKCYSLYAWLFTLEELNTTGVAGELIKQLSPLPVSCLCAVSRL